MSSAPVSLARLAYANVFAKDIDRLSRFYADLFGFRILESHSSPIYRCVDAGGIELGFNAPGAYELLNLADRKPAAAGGVNVYFTFEVAHAADVGRLAGSAVVLGGRILKPPYDTYYNARQAVLEDPEGNVFRVNHRKGPRVPAPETLDPPRPRPDTKPR